METTHRDRSHARPMGPAFPTAFEPGDTAYVYRASATEAAIRVGEEPSDVARTFAFLETGRKRGIYVAETRSAGPDRFAVRIDRQA